MTEPRFRWAAAALAYGAMLALAGAVFLWIRSIGESISQRIGPAARGAVSASPSTPAINTVAHVLLALVAIIVVTQVMRRVAASVGQPPVVGEIIGGIMLGPSLLGRLAPGAFASLLPPTVASFLGVYAQIGVILYMFLVGLELDLGQIRKYGHAAIAISHASIVVPFLLGSSLALFLYPLVSSAGVPFTVFGLFVAVSMSITAFPVLARILTDRNLHRTDLGALALTCAAVDDATAWCLLALVVSIAHANGAAQGMTTALLTLAFIAAMFGVARPLIRRALPSLESGAGLTLAGVGAIFAAMLASAMATEYIGIHGIFGAFLFGAAMPHDARIVRALRDRLDDVVAVLFLPAFFAYTGLRTEIALMNGARDWMICAVIIVVACAGKFGGTYVAGRLAGFKARDSARLGVLMNTRGLVELIALNIGLDLGIISPRLFAMLVMMALATTLMTTPTLQLLRHRRAWAADGAVAREF